MKRLKGSISQGSIDGPEGMTGEMKWVEKLQTEKPLKVISLRA